MDAAKIAIEWTGVLFAAAPKIFALFEKLGTRDAVLAALDSSFALARSKNDRDLAAKVYPAPIEDGDRKALASMLRDSQLVAHMSAEQKAALRAVTSIAIPVPDDDSNGAP